MSILDNRVCKKQERKWINGGGKKKNPRTHAHKPDPFPHRTHDLHEKFDRESSECVSVTSSQLILPGRLTKQRIAVLRAHSKKSCVYFNILHDQRGLKRFLKRQALLFFFFFTIRMGWVELGYVPRGGVMKLGKRDGRCFWAKAEMGIVSGGSLLCTGKWMNEWLNECRCGFLLFSHIIQFH